jgi:hypothetical protein
LIPADVPCSVIDFVVDEGLFERTQGSAVIIFPTEITRVWRDRFESDHRNPTGIRLASRQKSLLQLLFNPQTQRRLADACRSDD